MMLVLLLVFRVRRTFFLDSVTISFITFLPFHLSQDEFYFEYFLLTRLNSISSNGPRSLNEVARQSLLLLYRHDEDARCADSLEPIIVKLLPLSGPKRASRKPGDPSPMVIDIAP